MAGVFCGLMVLACGVAAGQADAARCGGLTGLKLDGAKVTSAVLVEAGGSTDVPRVPAEKLAGLPAFCRVQVSDKPSADSDVKVEVWLPVKWNGRYRGTGNGGFAGEIYFAEMMAALGQGYATSGTDTGHTEQGAGWALGQPAVDASVRLYMVPGMLHCGGGPGVTDLGQGGESARGDAQHDVFTGLVDWVEAGKAPGMMVAKGHGMTRPVCVYPQVRKFVGGERKDAGSWSCVAPAK